MEPTVRALRTVDRRVPLLLVTEAAGEPDARRAVRLGFNDYFIEPLRGDEIVSAMRYTNGNGSNGNGSTAHSLEHTQHDDLLIEALIDPRHAPTEVLAHVLSEMLAEPIEIAEPDDPRPGITLRYAGRAIGRLVSQTVAPERMSTLAGFASNRLALIQQHERFRHEAYHDQLTGAWNRRYFEQVFDDILHRAQLNRFRVSLMIFDIDDFKHLQRRLRPRRRRRDPPRGRIAS